MKLSKPVYLFILIIFLNRPASVWAHTGVDTHAGMLSNIIAIGIVMLSIAIYLLIDQGRRNKTPRNKN
ncbi:hypothetical protein MATR_00550 [Marivirga tractuosa]|uniref:Uncharacterized protein n=1 Tax=Marivirga tractuosa (strain ATCC 23168 / DSM 4126 / NBRC 15989 / NCIMB 1408 / VKM B-1430 / H-43) TaxID=643867 RepID=E4TLJ9_MARTH|nr:hypothetical protein [Marivirga tractuosa]ADR22303.1 hypothetical protein Ftrac_2325 [Marivirga tractuosa DSM 4126]BDD13230.1 hypothetical protein MATR_00550 [Marivirga tractuosa]